MELTEAVGALISPPTNAGLRSGCVRDILRNSLFLPKHSAAISARKFVQWRA